jgi:hypothetical protein
MMAAFQQLRTCGMGEARRKRAQAQQMTGQRDAVEAAVKQVSHAIRRLAEAASASLGADCYMHAEMGRMLLGDLGFQFETRVGYAAWRIGSADGDVLGHTHKVKSYLPPGAKGFPYHAWLTAGDFLIDFTTYQLRRKAAELDAVDGGHTNVDWCPDYLLLTRAQVMAYRAVAVAPAAGVAYYEADPTLAPLLARSYTLDADDIAHARLIMRNPDMQVLGPNMLK